MAKIKANKQSLIRWKVYFDRARMYIGYLQFLMIGFVFLKDFRDTSIGNFIFGNMYISIPVLFILFVLLSLIIGRMDTVYGLREEEMRNLSNSNPVLRNINFNIEEMRKEIRDLKKSESSE